MGMIAVKVAEKMCRTKEKKNLVYAHWQYYECDSGLAHKKFNK
jgi:hypothetical protein